MKILWIAKHDKPDSDHQCDHLFHGLRTLLGPDIVDVVRADRAYTSSFGEGKLFNDLSFTFGGLLPDIEVDRTDISNKIKNRYFDFVFYGSIYRDKTFLSEVYVSYPRSKRVFIDGEDEQFFTSEKGEGFYFKRELLAYDPDVIPIQFAIPRQKIVDVIPVKKHLWSPVDSRDKRTYVTNESEYYKQYSESYFGYTTKRGGWDCLRHYEIIAAGALPYFEGLENCPAATMELLPKRELILARRLCDTWEDDFKHQELWNDLSLNVRTVLKNHLTTEALAKRVLDRITQ